MTVEASASVQPDDFEPDGPAPHGATVGYLLTNQMNLNGILSSRLIGPRVAFGKYYQDPLELTGGVPALLPSAPHQDLVAYATERTRSGPALLEVVLARPLAGVTTVDAVPVRAVRAVHVPDEKQRRALVARKYNNVRPGTVRFTVSPELFVGSITAADLAAAAAAAAVGTTALPVDSWPVVDRVRGASSAAVAGAADPVGVEWALSMLDARSVEDWMARFASDEVFDSDSEKAIARAAARVFISSDVQRAWDPAAVLAAVSDDPGITSLSSFERNIVVSNIETVATIVSGHREFLPFSTTTRGLRIAKALLLALLRHDLVEQLSWPSAETGADQVTRQVAATLTGLLRGLSREVISVRSDLVDDLTAQRMSPVVVAEFGLSELSARIQKSADEFLLTISGEIVARAERRIDPLALFDATDPSRAESVGAAIARALNDPSLEVVIVTAPSVELRSLPGVPVAVTFRGGAVVTTEVDRVALRARLQSLTDQEVRLVVSTLKRLDPDATGGVGGSSSPPGLER